MRIQKRTRRMHGRAAAAAAATAIVTATTLVGAPAQATATRARAEVVDDVLTITGTNAGDRITVDFTPLDSVVVDLGGENGTRRFAAGSFDSAYVDLRAGDDEYRTLSGGTLADVPLTVRGGNGEDLLLGGARADTLFGGRGADFVNGRVGNDVEILGNGDDIAAWNPGEGSDPIDGGLGRDTLVFNGANGDEQMSLSANGQSAVFLRAQGTIRMDLDGVERLDLATFGGADTVTINDLSGTELTSADIDLTAAAGLADADTVLVNGTGLADSVDVAANSGSVDVTGLAARTSVSGGNPTDVLRISTFLGDDSVSVSDAARALLDIQADLGVDQS